MKKALFILTLAAISFQSCATSEGKTTDDKLSAATSSNTQNDRLITKSEFVNKIWNYEESPNEWKFLGTKPVIIDFYADWCGPCKTASPILESVAEEFAGQIEVYKINTDEERELAGIFGISSIPAFLYIPVTGKPVMSAGIARTNEETKNMFIDNINTYLLNK